MSTDPLELLNEELRVEDTKVRVDAVARIRTIGLALGAERARKDLIAVLTTVIQDHDDEVLMSLAEALGDCVDSVGGGEHAHVLLPLLETLSEVEETVVREKAVISLCKVGGQMPAAPFAENFVPLLKRLAASEAFSSRISACGLFATAYPTSTSVVKGALRKLFTQLATDEMPMVRSAAFAHLPIFALQVDKPLLKSELLPLFQRLAQDEQEAVRSIAVENLVKMSKFLTSEENTQAFMQIIHGFADDKCSKVRLDRATFFCDLADAVGVDTAKRELLSVFIKLLQDQETDVRSSSASNLPRFCNMLDVPVIIGEILPIIKTLVTDSQANVRVALSSVLAEMTQHLGSEASVTHILPLLNDLIKDENAEVRMNVVSHLEVLQKSVGSEVLSETILRHMLELAKDKQWRVRIAIVDGIPIIAQSIGAPAYERRLLEVQLTLLSDTVASVREASAVTILKLAKVFGEAWISQHILPTIREMSQTKTSYLARINALVCIASLASASSPDLLGEILLPICISLAKDPVANVRFTAAKAITAIVRADAGAHIEAKARPVLTEMQRDDDIDVKHFASVGLALCK